MHKGIKVLAAFSIIIIALHMLNGCSSKDSAHDYTPLDYTVVEEEDIPSEIKTVIESHKRNAMKLTYSVGEYTYIIAGYGSRTTSGYSISVNEVSECTDNIRISTTLHGPGPNETVTSTTTYPYIVIKIEKRDMQVIYDM